MPDDASATAPLDLPLDVLRRRRSAKWAHVKDDVLPAWVAEMDLALAPPITAALRRAVEDGDAGYAYPVDVPAAFAAFAAQRLGWQVDPADVLVAPDVMVGVAELLRTLTRPGDGVVINPPVYPPFAARIAEVGCHVVEAPLAFADDGTASFDLDALDGALAGGARVLLLCHPHNPTGIVLDRATLLAIADVVERHGAIVVSDEIHAPLVLPPHVHVPFVSLDHPAARRAVTLTSASKAWNVPGLKSAVAVPGPELRDHCERLPEDVLRWGSGNLGGVAAVAAYREGGVWLDRILVRLGENRALLADLLAHHLPDVGYVPPEASFLAWLDCRALGLGDDPAKAFHARGRVLLSPGPSFGSQGAGFARLNIGTSPALLEEAVVRMARAVSDAPAPPR